MPCIASSEPRASPSGFSWVEEELVGLAQLAEHLLLLGGDAHVLVQELR